MPVIMAAREGLQSIDGTCAFEKTIPCAANRSMFGVIACGWPPKGPTQSFKSSIAINRTSGCVGCWAWAAIEAIANIIAPANNVSGFGIVASNLLIYPIVPAGSVAALASGTVRLASNVTMPG